MQLLSACRCSRTCMTFPATSSSCKRLVTSSKSVDLRVFYDSIKLTSHVDLYYLYIFESFPFAGALYIIESLSKGCCDCFHSFFLLMGGFLFWMGHNVMDTPLSKYWARNYESIFQNHHIGGQSKVILLFSKPCKRNCYHQCSMNIYIR